MSVLGRLVKGDVGADGGSCEGEGGGGVGMGNGKAARRAQRVFHYLGLAE